MKDELGRRIKENYEDALRLYLPRRSYIVVRIDGRGFHTFTRNLERPYCRSLAQALDTAALALAAEMMGCKFAFGQSDEYSFLATDFETESARMWFDGNVQKIASVSASIFTAAFARAFASEQRATFDARVLLIPQASEVEKYFIWRQLDASANSLNMLASAHYGHEELLGKTEAQKHDLLHAKGLNWAKEPTDFKRGRVVRRSEQGHWYVDGEAPVFQREPSYLGQLIPRL
jgi:tRNA(His) 5'-end guanylyltransferase